LAVRPGTTGTWQVRRQGTRGLDDMTRLGLEYIDRFSLRLDVRIMARTLPCILGRRWRF